MGMLWEEDNDWVRGYMECGMRVQRLCTGTVRHVNSVGDAVDRGGWRKQIGDCNESYSSPTSHCNTSSWRMYSATSCAISWKLRYVKRREQR